MKLSKESVQGMDGDGFVNAPAKVNSYIIVYGRTHLSSIGVYEADQHDYRRDIRHTFYKCWYQHF